MQTKYKVYKLLFAFISFIAMVLVYILLGFILYKGFSYISMELIFADTNPIDALLLKQRVFDGIFPAIIGTFMLIILALSFSLVFGFSAGIYLSIYAKDSTKKIVNFSFELLASVPSILIGLFFLLLSIYLYEQFQVNFMPSLLLSSLALSILIMPYLVQNTKLSLDNIPTKIRQTGINLGLTSTQNLFKILLPYCSKELLSGIFLSLGRACEDTAVIMLTGAVASAGIASSIFDKFEALPFYIYYLSTNYADDKELSQAFAASLILLLIALFLFLLTKIIQQKFRRNHGYN